MPVGRIPRSKSRPRTSKRRFSRRARTLLMIGLATATVTAVGLAADVMNVSADIRLALVLIAAVIAGIAAVLIEGLVSTPTPADGVEQPPDSDAAALLVPRQVPRPTRHFIGRSTVVTELVEALTLDDPTAAAIVAVNGQGGVGKSALAFQLAHLVADEYPAGQLFASLRGPDAEPIPPGEVLTIFLDALGVDEALIPERIDDRVRLYNTRLAGRRMLIVLDNAVDEAQVRPLIPVAAECGVIITSRRPLEGLVDAVQVALDVISVDESVDLLGRVAGADRIAEEPEAAQQLVALVGRLPLAVRILGARLQASPHLSVAELVRRLRDGRQRLSELKAGDLDVRASLGLSYDDLNEVEKRAFRLLGLVRGATFCTWALAAILDSSVQQATRLADSLVEFRLLEGASIDKTGTLRYRFHDLIRAFGTERLYAEEPAADREAALHRLVGAYLALADEACRHDEHGQVPGGSAGWAVRFARPRARWHAEDPELLRIVQSRPSEWYEQECRPIARTVKQVHGTGDWSGAWELAAMLTGHIEIVSGFWQRWDETFEYALDAAIKAGRRDGEAALRFANGLYLADQDRFADAVDSYRAALTIYQDLGDVVGQTQALTLLGETTRLLGRFTEAAGYLRDALELARESGDRYGEAGALRDLGGIYRWQHRYAEEEQSHREALDITRELGLRADVARVLRKLSVAVRLQGRLAESEQLAGDALRIFEELNLTKWKARTQLSLAQTRIEQGMYVEADQLLSAALTKFEETGSQGLGAEVLNTLARLRLAQGRHEGAIACAERALEMRRGLGQRLWEASALRVLGQVHRDQGRYEEARACLDEAITINGEYDDGWAQADARRMLASVDRAERRFDDALQQLGAALEIFRDYGDRWAEVETLRDLAETYAASGDRTQAKELSRQAREIVRALQDPVAS
jgi:tetratricopeptide (TPR) repeat protein